MHMPSYFEDYVGITGNKTTFLADCPIFTDINMLQIQHTKWKVQKINADNAFLLVILRVYNVQDWGENIIFFQTIYSKSL